MTCGFPKEERLLKRPDFISLSAGGKKFPSSNFLVIVRKNHLGHPRVGLTVSRKVGNAVVRNRVKRLIREFFRMNKSLFDEADHSIIAKPGASHLDFRTVSAELVKVLSRAHAKL
ncbi:ribonuclease P protein component [Geobacter sp. DSM 9736]|uniref:ribonuclease P protein component n=1 Tax=Geobacter sp. DSM 9736 TaxID=1277350 RepID=UPI000B4FFED7|nr:ribonuclease P protein component [Geobacter sp. DSM 9736]SNB47286.1 ribonuclease P protein component [Geobacter sp. DSM 9736]